MFGNPPSGNPITVRSGASGYPTSENPVTGNPYMDNPVVVIVPPFATAFVKVKESCEIDAIKKYIKNQLVKGPQNCKIEDYNDIVLNFKGLDQNGKTRIKQIKTVYDCKK